MMFFQSQKHFLQSFKPVWTSQLPNYSCSRERVSIHKFTSTGDGQLPFKKPISLSEACQPLSTCSIILC